MELSIPAAAKRYRVSQQGLLEAIRRGVLPAITVPVLEIRVKTRDLTAYVATIPEWRQRAGREGARKKWENYRAQKARAARAPAAP